MTLPDERIRAINKARKFLVDLMDPKKTPKVPSAIRKEARSVLKHYPWDYHCDLYMEAEEAKEKRVHRILEKYSK